MPSAGVVRLMFADRCNRLLRLQETFQRRGWGIRIAGEASASFVDQVDRRTLSTLRRFVWHASLSGDAANLMQNFLLRVAGRCSSSASLFIVRPSCFMSPRGGHSRGCTRGIGVWSPLHLKFPGAKPIRAVLSQRVAVNRSNQLNQLPLWHCVYHFFGRKARRTRASAFLRP